MDLFSPPGAIGAREKDLILLSLALMLLLVIPVILLSLYGAWHYRARNKEAVYAPKLAQSIRLRLLAWTIGCVIVGVLALLIRDTTYATAPYKPLASKQAPVNVEVVALNWKWLFIYPDYGVASLNQLAIPVDTPIAFRLTAASDMNSFLIPQLGGQVEAMAGVQTRLHLIADTPGVYYGRSAASRGAGVPDMTFETRAMRRAEFLQWIQEAARAPEKLNSAAYLALEKPGIKVPVARYAAVEPGLFEGIVNKYIPEDPSMQLPWRMAPAATIALLRQNAAGRHVD